MTLYHCPDCNRWHNGTGHICTDPLPKIHDTNSLKSAVVKAARDFVSAIGNPGFMEGAELARLIEALRELDGLDRPLEGK